MVKFLQTVETGVQSIQDYLDQFSTKEITNSLEKAYEAAKAFAIVLAAAKVGSMVWALAAAAKAAYTARAAFLALGANPIILAFAAVVAGIVWAMEDYNHEIERLNTTTEGLTEKIADMKTEIDNGGYFLASGRFVAYSNTQLEEYKKQLEAARKKLAEIKKQEFKDTLPSIDELLAGGSADTPAHLNPDGSEVLGREEQKLRDRVDKMLADANAKHEEAQDAGYMQDVFGGTKEQAQLDALEHYYEKVDEIEAAQEVKEKERKDRKNISLREADNARITLAEMKAAALDRIEEKKAARELAANEKLQKAKVKALHTYLKASGVVAGALANQSKTAFRIHKGVATAEAIINTHQSITAALSDSEVHPWVRVANAAFFAAQGFASVSAIQSQNYSGGGGGGGSSVGGGGGVSAGTDAQTATTFTSATQAAEGLGETATERREIILDFGDRNLFNKEDIRMIITEIEESAGDGVVANVNFVGAT